MGLIQKEYEILRQEIVQKMELHNTLLMFTITSTILVITIAASEDEAIMYLFPFCVIIPMALRIAYYRKAMAKLSAYMIVFLEPKLEGINWEKRNYVFSKYFGGLSSNKRKFKISYYECFVLSCVCYTLYLLDILNCKWERSNGLVILEVLCPIILVVWVAQITYKMNRVDKDRDDLIEKWNKIKTSEE